MRAWPPLVWPLMSFASLLILMGLGPWEPAALIAGVALAIVVFAAAVRLALARSEDRRRTRMAAQAVSGVLVAFYLACAAAAALAGAPYALAAVFAGTIPISTALLVVATARLKTAEEDGRLRELSAEGHEDPAPGIGMDADSPLGDTSQHSDAGA
jgi:hypothetical protein